MRKPRLALDPLAYKALRVWSALEDIDIDVLVGRLTFANMPERVRDAIGEEPASPQDKEDTDGEVHRPKQLVRDTAGIARIRELWPSGMSIADIARDLGRPRQTVTSQIDRMLAAGELAERPK